MMNATSFLWLKTYKQSSTLYHKKKFSLSTGKVHSAYTYNFEDTHIIITQNNACVHIRTMDSTCT